MNCPKKLRSIVCVERSFHERRIQDETRRPATEGPGCQRRLLFSAASRLDRGARHSDACPRGRRNRDALSICDQYIGIHQECQSVPSLVPFSPGLLTVSAIHQRKTNMGSELPPLFGQFSLQDKLMFSRCRVSSLSFLSRLDGGRRRRRPIRQFRPKYQSAGVEQYGGLSIATETLAHARESSPHVIPAEFRGHGFQRDSLITNPFDHAWRDSGQVARMERIPRIYITTHSLCHCEERSKPALDPIEGGNLVRGSSPSSIPALRQNCIGCRISCQLFPCRPASRRGDSMSRPR